MTVLVVVLEYWFPGTLPESAGRIPTRMGKALANDKKGEREASGRTGPILELNCCDHVHALTIT